MARMAYGMEILPIDDAGLNEMETAHKQHAKIVQNVPMNVPNPAPLATIGWMSVTSHVAIMKLCFLWRILCLHNDNIYKRIVICVLNEIMNGEITTIMERSSPITSMYIMAKKYHITTVIKHGLIMGILGPSNMPNHLLRR